MLQKNKALGWFLKTLVFGAFAWLLYNQIWLKQDFSTLLRELQGAASTPSNLLFLLIAIILMPINWLLEAFKWQSIVSKFEEFSYSKAIRSVFLGINIGIVTPNRIGEYGGRILLISDEKKPQGIVANFVCSLAQNTINIGIGAILFFIFFTTYFEFSTMLIAGFATGGLAMAGVLFYVYTHIGKLDQLLSYLPDWKWIRVSKMNVANFPALSGRHLAYLSSISLARYLVFSVQYVCLLYFFGITDQLIPAYLAVGSIFFIQSGLPLPPFLSVLARTEIAILVFGIFSTNTLGILTSTFSLWFLNLIVPAAIGLIILWRTPIFEKEPAYDLKLKQEV